jgi:hypothetical protein
VWAPIGERPIAQGHHRFDWLYVTAFVSPASGETFWYLSNGVAKEFFEALLKPLRVKLKRAYPASFCSCSIMPDGTVRQA